MIRFGCRNVRRGLGSCVGLLGSRHVKFSSTAGSNFTKIFGVQSAVAPVPMNASACELSLHSGKVAHFADSSVVCRYGNTVIHVAISTAKAENPTSDFLPLTVDYRNRMYAHGAFPTGSNRRERSTDEEILVSRIIDRCVRPLFPKGYVNEVQVTVTAHAVDATNTGGDPVVASIVAASYALRKSSQPWYLTPSREAAAESGLLSASGNVIGCVRVGLVDGQMVVNPTQEQMHCSDMDLLYCGTEYRPLMIEFSGKEVPEAQVSAALEAAQQALLPVIQYQKDLQAEEAGTDRQLKTAFLLPPALRDAVEQFGYARAVEIFSGKSISAGADTDPERPSRAPTKFERSRAEGMLMGEMLKWLQEQGPSYAETGGAQLHPVVQGMAASHVMRKAFRSVLLTGDRKERDTTAATAAPAIVTVRADGRQLTELRPIECFTDILPAPVHGSAVFRRGDTHVLCSTTLGSKVDGKSVGALQPHIGSGGSGGGAAAGEATRRPVDNFMLHYDFPPYCTGKVGNATSLDRRMVGHGYLAEKAIRGVLPPFNNFPYTVRLYAECTSSSGSSSMASVVGGCLALVDAGVPVKNLVAGASVGLVTGEEYSVFPTTETDGPAGAVGAGGGNYTLITDILGSEDYYGDMDFKVAGSREGVTAIQLDIKLPYGIPIPILSEALMRARDARLHIIDQMEGATQTELGYVTLNVSAPSSTSSDGTAVAVGDNKLSSMVPMRYLRCAESMKSYAPRAQVISYSNFEKRKNIIGPAGEMKRYIQESFNVALDIEELGAAYVYGHSPDSNVQEAALLVKDLVTEISPDEVFHNVSIVEVKDFGLTIRLTRSQNALLHISELSHNEELIKLKSLSDVFEPGQVLSGGIVVLQVDNATGLVKASRKRLLSPDSKDSDAFVFENPLSMGGAGTGSRSSITAAGAGAVDIPLVPPRKYDKTFFSNQVVSREDAEKAYKKLEETGGSTAGGGGAPKGSRGYSTLLSRRRGAAPGRADAFSTLADITPDAAAVYRRVKFTSEYAEEEDDSENPLQRINSTVQFAPGDDTNVTVLSTNEFHATVAHKVPCATEDELVRQAERSFVASSAASVVASTGAERAADWSRRYSKKSVLLNDLQDIDSLLDASVLSALKENARENSTGTLFDSSQSLTGKVKSLFDVFSRTISEVLAEKDPEPEPVLRHVGRKASLTQNEVREVSTSVAAADENNELYGIIDILQKQRSLLQQTDCQTETRTEFDAEGDTEESFDVSKLSQREFQESANKGERIKQDMLQLFNSYSTGRNGGLVGTIQDKTC